MANPTINNNPTAIIFTVLLEDVEPITITVSSNKISNKADFII